MSIPSTRSAPTGSGNPLLINLSAPPVGTRTTITLARSTATSDVAVTTESTLIANVQEESSGIIGYCMRYVKGAWTAICNWFLYVFHFFFPPSALSAITQVEQNLERSHHEQRRWMEERQRELIEFIARGRPAEPPVGTGVPDSAVASVIPRPFEASLRMGALQRERLMKARVNLAEIKSLVEAVTDDQVIGTQWKDAADLKQYYRDTCDEADLYIKQLNDYSRYAQEGTADKAGTCTGVSDVPDIVGVEAHYDLMSKFFSDPDSNAV